MSTYQVTDRRPIANVFRRLAALPVRWCVLFNIHPNLISYASIVASVAAAFCFLAPSFAAAPEWLPLLGVGCCFLRLYFNMLDGMVALASGKACATGEIANELPDRVSDVFIFTAIAHCGPLLLGYWCAILSLLVAYTGTLGKAIGAERDFSGPMSKPWRMVVLSIGIVADFILFKFMPPTAPPMMMAPVSGLYLALIFIVLGCLVTFVRRLVRITSELQTKTEVN